MSFIRRIAPLAAAAACAVWGAAAEPASRPGGEPIARWVRQLGDDDFSVREEASKKLYEAGQAAEEALRAAARSNDAEVARRAGEILDKFKWGLYPDAPKKVAELVTRYRSADQDGKDAVIRELLGSGEAGRRTLLKIAGAEDDPATRGRIFAETNAELTRVAPQMIVDDDHDKLPLLLDVALVSDPVQGVGSYAAYWMMRGKLDERIAYFKARAAGGEDAARDWGIVARLERARGDLAAAFAAAEKADDPTLVDALLFEAGDWKALAKRPVRTKSNLPSENLAFQAAYCRLAGDAKGCDDALGELRKATGAGPGDEFERFNFAKALFLNDRPVEAVDVLVETPGRQAAAFEALAARMNYKAALALADKAVAAGAPDAPVLEILKARTLYSLGDKEKAQAIFTRYADQIKGPGEQPWAETLIDAEKRVGLKDQAAEQAAVVLATPHPENLRERLFAKLFPKKAQAAEALWPLLFSGPPNRTPAAAMKVLRGLLEGAAEPKELGDVVSCAEGLPDLPAGSDREKRWDALAEAALAAKDEKQARSLLEKSGSANALIRLGDLHADKKEWDKAVERYQQAWDKDQAGPLALYLSGWAMAEAGRHEEGTKRMELSHWTLLGECDKRLDFLRALAARGQQAAVGREGELLARLSIPGTLQAAEGMRQTALAALSRKEYLAAADGQERSMVRCIGRDVGFVQPAAYLGVPALVHRLRAQGYTAAGRFDEAKAEAAIALAALPGDTFVPIELVPAWDAAGRKKEAAALFEKCLAVQEKLCKEYPDCPWGHNSVAWISACCRRNLDSAREHALKAVELAPGNAGDLDTLAEVYFQRGEKDKAVETEKKAVALEPGRGYFRKQLRRVEAGDPAADRPAEDGDDD